MAGRVILLLCGIPGAGKSTLARRLYDKYTEDNQSALVISYDHFQQPKESWNENTFTESRIRSLEYLTSILQDHNSGIIIVDDLMYYRSMRKEIYRIGTKYQAHLVVIHIDTPLEIALRRNRDRHEASRIPDEVVRNIWDRFEPPSKSHRWERHSITYYDSEALSACPWNQFFLSLCAVVEEAKLDCFEPPNLEPLIPPPPSVLQLLDLSLRQIISQIMKAICSHSSMVDSVQRKKMSELLSREKEFIFDEAKKGYRLSSHLELSGQSLEADESAEWTHFIDDWKAELVRAVQRSNRSQNETEQLLFEKVRNALAALDRES